MSFVHKKTDTKASNSYKLGPLGVQVVPVEGIVRVRGSPKHLDVQDVLSPSLRRLISKPF